MSTKTDEYDSAHGRYASSVGASSSSAPHDVSPFGTLHNPPVSEKQARLFGAVAGGKSTKASGMSPSQAKEQLRGVDVKALPESK